MYQTMLTPQASILPIWYTSRLIDGQLQILRSQNIQINIDPPVDDDPEDIDPPDVDSPADPGPPGPMGPQGEPGPQGPQGDPGICDCCQHAILVQSDYIMANTDYYVGVRSDSPTTITLPVSVDCNRTFVIKAEMGPPLGNRKVTITTSDGSTIDGEPSVIFTTPYECITLVYRDGWHIISHV